MFIATYRLPLGVALSLTSSSASTDIVFESGSFPGLLLAGWTAIGFILLVLIGLWHDRFVDPVEHDPLRRKKLAFHRDIGGFITLGFGALLGSAFIWVFGPMIMFSTKPWLSPFGQVFVQLVTTVAAVTAFALSALYLPTMLAWARQALQKKPATKQPPSKVVVSGEAS